MSKSLLIILVAALFAFPATAQTPAMGQPGISPDGTEIAFASGGDVWTVPASGGEAQLLVSGPSDESHPLYSPDGSRIAFVSDRTGNGDIYVLDLRSGALQRMTWDDDSELLDGWSADGKWIYLSTSTEEIGGLEDIYRVSVSGGTPMPVSAESYVNEYFAAPSPDGKSLAFVGKGFGSFQWWRHGRSHIDESDLWLMEGSPATYRRLTTAGAKQLWPMWSPDGSTIYFTSDRSGSENLWSLKPGAVPGQLTDFKTGRLLWPTISHDGKKIAFERDFAIWTFDVASGKASPVTISLRGAAAGVQATHLRINDNFDELALSPDGKKVAVIAHGEVFVASAKDGGDAFRVTRTVEPEIHVSWAPDSRRIAYSSYRDGHGEIYLYDFSTRKESRVTHSDGSSFKPRFSPDGKRIAYLRDGHSLRVVDLASDNDWEAASGTIDLPPPFALIRGFVWSPDGGRLGLTFFGDHLFRNAEVVDVAVGETRPARQISFVANTFNNTISWSSDGSTIYFDTGQRTEREGVASIDLQPRSPKFHEQQLRDLFQEEPPKSVPQTEKKEATPPKDNTTTAPAKVTPAKEIVFEGIRQRLSYVPVGLDVDEQALSSDGKQMLLLGRTGTGDTNLYVYSLDELATEKPVAKQITSTSGEKSNVQFSPDGKDLFYLEDGRVMTAGVESQKAHPIAITAEMDVDFDQEKKVVFEQAWEWMRDLFHDPKMNGADWNAVHAAFAPRVAAARSPEELHRLLRMMVGELNASHLGSRGAGQPQRYSGHVGLRFDRSEYEESGRMKITSVVPLSPAAVSRKIAPGNYLLAVNGTSLDHSTNLDELLAYQVGKEVVLSIADDASGKGRRDVSIRPVNGQSEEDLNYRAWVESNRDYVRRISGGRLGYVHIFDMSSQSMTQLLVDLDAENETRDGVVVDIRNNSGGFIDPYAIDVFSRTAYLQMQFRSIPTVAPERTVLGQRALERPTVLVTNRHSLSDAENFTEGYRALHLGKVVGEPTAGWIIFTSNETLIDGSRFRIPFMTVTASDGSPLEMHPRPVDIFNERPLGEGQRGVDTDLDLAVKTLLGQLPAK